MKPTFVALTVILVSIRAWGGALTVGQLASSNPNAFPFGSPFDGNPGTRYQQAYAASDFAGLGAVTITSISFLQGMGTLGSNSYSLYFSTISAGIGSLSDTDFNANRGPDNSLFVSTKLSGPAPATLTFTGNPFTYNPAEGNLLLDMVVSPGGSSPNLAFYAANTNAPALFDRYHNFGTGTTGYGLVTEFTYTAVPEPTTGVLIGLFLAGVSRRAYYMRK